MPTVAGRLSDSISRALRLEVPPQIVCAGRTDAGVHATGQVVHADLPAEFTGDLAKVVNRQVAPSIVVRSAHPVEESFDARRSATWRHYRYLVHDAPQPTPLLAHFVWHVEGRLDLHAMECATDPLLGEHDFRAFCRRAPGTSPEDPINRQVLVARWTRVDAGRITGGPALGSDGGLLRFDIVATSFCHQMVRSVVALLVDAGGGRSNAASVMEHLASHDRAGAPRPAPPSGLCLVGVGYGGGLPSAAVAR